MNNSMIILLSNIKIGLTSITGLLLILRIGGQDVLDNAEAIIN